MTTDVGLARVTSSAYVSRQRRMFSKEEACIGFRDLSGPTSRPRTRMTHARTPGSDALDDAVAPPRAPDEWFGLLGCVAAEEGLAAQVVDDHVVHVRAD